MAIKDYQLEVEFYESNYYDIQKGAFISILNELNEEFKNLVSDEKEVVFEMAWKQFSKSEYYSIVDCQFIDSFLENQLERALMVVSDLDELSR